MLILALMWAVVICAGIAAVVSRCMRDSRTAALLVLVASIAFAVRVIPAGFYGLEYEDAYVYAAAAKFEAAQGNVALLPDWTLSVCAVGSINLCEQTEGYPGHLNAYPALIRVLVPVVGSGPHVFPLIGAALATFATLGVWWASILLCSSRFAAFGAAFLYASTPALALYGGSAVSETASSAALGVWCGASLQGATAQGRRQTVAWWLLAIVAATLAGLIRRENLICIPLTAGCVLFSSFGSVTRRTRVVIAAAAVALTVALFSIAGRSLLSEAGEYGEFSFSAGRLLSAAPAVVGALAAPKYFLLMSWLAGFGALLISRRLLLRTGRASDIVGLCIVVALFVWIVSYAAHVRSIYQLSGFAPQAFDYLRYLTNAGVPTAVLASVAFAFAHRRRERLMYVATIALVVAGCVASFSLRAEVAHAEMATRIEPARAALEAAAALGGVPVITLEPLVAQLQGHPSSFVVGLPWLDKALVQRLGDDVLYLEHDAYRNDVDVKRYAVGFESLLQQRQLISEGAGWRLWRLGQGDPTK